MSQAISQLQTVVWRFYAEHGRSELPWRQPQPDGGFDPYCIIVSELMLQQTQVSRVIPKYQQFLEQFPDVQSLAAAALGEVLVAWQGLGYNRRAKFLWQMAQQVVREDGSRFPDTADGLKALPGIGANTAGAVLAYAYNRPVAFVETNIRTVFIHHCFKDQTDIPDKAILELVAQALPDTRAVGVGEDARHWYWALMDYGSFLKQTVGNKSRASKAYVKQSPFAGSRRAVRGAVIRQLAARPRVLADLEAVIGDPRLPEVMADLVREGMVAQAGEAYRLA